MKSAAARFFVRIALLRRTTIRYERLASTHLALIQIACIIIYMRGLQ